MNFNLYLDDQTAKELDRMAKKLGETRSGLICKALRAGGATQAAPIEVAAITKVRLHKLGQ